ncbi:DUF4360 domain-containing protein [Actinoplanes sp. M2I2]|uniref:DUF4360 domain-containing protein n=1 Tax=Actinoplanes sp. M2I2 TaxID=1734444 RepID=UPI00202249F3|nr:DUF4360 domain-containing protein [Actinoplanes sp. M2I2]
MLKSLAMGATLFGALTAVVAPATAASAAPPRQMVIDVIAANGSGCPKGTAQVTASRDRKAFTVTYSQFTAQVGPDSKAIDFRKNCQLALNVRVPQGYTYAISSTDYRGFAHLERGASGSQSANYYFQGERQNSRIRHNFAGPMDGDWQRTDKVAIRSLSFRPCGEQRYLNVNTELRVNRGLSSSRKTSMLTMDSTDGTIDTVYHLAWKKC